MKRILDILAACVGLLILLSLFPALALLIKLDSPGPIFHSSVRVGRGLRFFKCHKLRSMVVDASHRGPYYTCEQDPRITRVGQLLRKTSLDELPQFWNVLIGEMSLIGPRPDSPQQMDDYTEEERLKRHSVLPGMTGLSQALYRNAATVEQRMKADLDYVDQMSLSLDARIVWLTIGQILFRGSY
ncbi:sugar transferase [bacterium CPR1]|nr:sugar transferase [bacterium CPR1]